MNSVWIVYQSDWLGISLYFDELSAYKAAVAEHAEVVQVGEGDIKDQAKNPRKFEDNPVTPTTTAPAQPTNNNKENPNGNQPRTRTPEAPIVNAQGFTAEQLEAQAKLKRDEESGPKDIGSFARGR